MRRPGDSAVKIRTMDQRRRAFSLGHGHHARLKSDFAEPHFARMISYTSGTGVVRPIQTPFGLRGPSLERAISALASLWGEAIVSNGGDAANWLGLTTQNAVRNGLSHFRPRPTPAIRCTPGQAAPCSALGVDSHTGNRRHRHSSDFLARSQRVERSPDALLPRLSQKDVEELAAARDELPKWIAEPLGRRVAHA